MLPFRRIRRQRFWALGGMARQEQRLVPPIIGCMAEWTAGILTGGGNDQDGDWWCVPPFVRPGRMNIAYLAYARKAGNCSASKRL